MSLNSKQKSICQLATTELYPKRQKMGNNGKWQKRAWVGWCLSDF